MKCVVCGHDSKYRERGGGKCPSCNHLFVFEPTRGDPFTDMAFKKAIDRVSANGKVRWVLDHLYYELLRGKRSVRAPRILGVLSLVAFGLSAAFFAVESEVGLPLVMAGGISGFFGLFKARQKPAFMPKEDFRKLWKRWIDVHGTPAHFIVPAPKRPAPTQELEAELSSYSFDRAVITDQRAIVDVLLANQFHFENNCAVLSADGYPEEIFPIVMKMLRKNPKLNVFVVHDASPEGCRLARMIQNSPSWFDGIGQVVDVGLRPGHAKFFHGLEVPLSEPRAVAPDGSISPKEATWLAKWRLELTAVRPEQLIKRLYRAIAGVESGEWGGSADAGVVYFGTEAGTSDGGGDSFG